MEFTARDAGPEFDRQRRRHALARIAARLRQEPDDVIDMMLLDDVVAALGRRGQTDRGIQTIPLESIVGTADRRSRDFDRAFRPATQRVRDRWRRVAAVRRRGADLPPIDAFRVGSLHFVEDGHHRVSVARAMGDTAIDARVREIRTVIPATPDLVARELALKHHERMFRQRVPLPPAARARVVLTDEWRYAQLGWLIEARGFRVSHARGQLTSREELARGWFHDQFEPIVALLRDVDMGGPGTDADRYLRFAMLRFLLLHSDEWNEDVVGRLLDEVRPPAADDDTLVHQILKEMQGSRDR